MNKAVQIMAKVIGIFSTPVMKADGFADAELIQGLTDIANTFQLDSNSASDLLTHTEMIAADNEFINGRLKEKAVPHLVNFGELLFAEKLDWTIKESWINVLKRGGSQFMHTHANSFISGVIYVTKPHTSAATIFRRPSGGTEFIFKNDVPNGHISSDHWQVPDVQQGDLLLFPSYLLHGVPPNDGAMRISLAFNAIPNRLDSLGYKISFAP